MSLITDLGNISVNGMDIQSTVDPALWLMALQQNRALLAPGVLESFNQGWADMPNSLEFMEPAALGKIALQHPKWHVADVRKVWKKAVNREAIATSLFEVFMKTLRSIGTFKYVYEGYTSLGLFNSEIMTSDCKSTGEEYLANCKTLAKGFGVALSYFGFDLDKVKLQCAPKPAGFCRDDIKILRKPAHCISTQDVRGYARNGRRELPNPADDSRGFKLVKRGFFSKNFDVVATDRDPFGSHFITYFEGFGLEYPYFDPLEGKRYRNGMKDMFDEYFIMGKFTWGKTGESFSIFHRLDDMRYRLYEVPEGMSFPNAAFRQARAKANEAGGLAMWLIVDPEDWATNPRDRPGPQQFARTSVWRHPPLLAELYGLSTK